MNSPCRRIFDAKAAHSYIVAIIEENKLRPPGDALCPYIHPPVALIGISVNLTATNYIKVMHIYRSDKRCKAVKRIALP